MKRKGLLCALLAGAVLALGGCGGKGLSDSAPASDVQQENEISDAAVAAGTEGAEAGSAESDSAEAGSAKSGGAEAGSAQAGGGTKIEPPAASMEESEAWLLYSSGSYAEVLVHVPEGQVSAQVCQKDGTDVEVNGERLFFGTRKLAPGWSLMVTNKIPGEYTMEDLAVKLIWEDGERIGDGTYPSTVITELGGRRTAEELRAGGMVVWDDHYGAMLEARTTYGSGSSTDLNAPSFGLFFELYFYGADMNTLPEDLGSQLTFFAGDGTPLEDYFEGFDSIAVEVNTASVYALLYRSDGEPYDEAQYKEMCGKLRACEPYMVFTGKDGAAQQFPLLRDK